VPDFPDIQKVLDTTSKYVNPGMLRNQLSGDSDHNWTDPYQVDSMGRPVKLKLRGLQEKATLPEYSQWQSENPELTAQYRYRHAWDPNNDTLGSQLGEGIASALGDPNNKFKTLARKGPWMAGGALGLGGAALGYGAGSLIEKLQGGGPEWSKLLAALLGAGGAAIGGIAGRNHTKTASFMQLGDPKAELLKMLQKDHSLSFTDRNRLMQALQMLSETQAASLKKLVGTGVGAGVGAMIAKALLGMGLGGQLLGAFVGGMVARSSMKNDGYQKNALGERTRPGYNAFGQPFRRF